jgi:hypothetical protein
MCIDCNENYFIKKCFRVKIDVIIAKLNTLMLRQGYEGFSPRSHERSESEAWGEEAEAIAQPAVARSGALLKIIHLITIKNKQYLVKPNLYL